ncbi:hypothetical protein D9619_004221 [Psilocybe cf. subviscida]|uniref:DUF4360 domain-containing protein n=1 Tax=Psilocybe cf. subviscida TaxID=2480587 RepID=A0A8H5BSC3_9AGAR|nr:hypothetical protein D9619_004221 [Psilocybe cf. subviscida]
MLSELLKYRTRTCNDFPQTCSDIHSRYLPSIKASGFRYFNLHMSSITTLITVTLLSSLYILGAFAQGYGITNYGAIGTGCPSGTVSTDLADDSKDIALTYKSFTVSTGPGADDSDERKNCQLTLSVKVPAGYQFALGGFNHTASYAISSGVQATVSSFYYFQTTTTDAKGSASFSGPAKYNGNVARGYAPTIWSPCSQSAVVGINIAAR